MGNYSFKDLIHFGTFSLVRVFRNLTPPSGRCWPLFALGLDRIKRYGCRCSGQDSLYGCSCIFCACSFICVCFRTGQWLVTVKRSVVDFRN